MKLDRKWLLLGCALAGAAAALALGVPLGTLLVVAALLACPAAMFLGMRGMQAGSGGAMACHPESQETRRDAAHPTATSAAALPDSSDPVEASRNS
ncbi:MAG: hypothetical protein ACT4P5_23525 [Armatimonadota bacterium]